MLYPSEVTQIEIIMVHDSSYLCLCYSSHSENSLYTCTWASLHFYQNVNFSMLWFFTFYIYSWEGTSLPQNSVYGFKCFTMWVTVEFHNSSPTIYLFSRLYYVSTSSCAHLTIILSSSICLCHSSLLPLIPSPPSVL